MTTKLALGTVQFGLPYGVANTLGQPSLDEVRRILASARSAGIDTLDTAVAYGDSQRRLGECDVTEWQIVSKLPARNENGQGAVWVRSCLQQALADLRVSKIAGLLLHQPALLLDPGGDEVYAGLCAVKREGLVGKIGVSVYSPAELDALISRFELDLVQLPFNVLDRRMLHSGWLNRLSAQGVEVHARSCFLQGLLLVNDDQRPRKFDRWSSIWRRWWDWLHETGNQPLQACLAYSLSFPQITQAVVGVDCERQMREILAASCMQAVSPPDDLFSDDEDLINPSRWNLF